MKNDKDKRFDAVKKGLRGGGLPYEKPRVESVKLFADQVLLVCIKTPGPCGANES